MENSVVYGDFRKLEGGGKDLVVRVSQLKLSGRIPATAHRLSAGLLRKATVKKRITEL